MTKEEERGEGPVVLITGGAGFLGQALARELLKPEAVLSPSELRLLDNAPFRRAPRDGRVQLIEGDVRSLGDLRGATDGVDLVFHCAAVIDWGQQPEALVESVNVGGARAVIRACQEAGVKALVHTSTLDVIMDGEPIRDADEERPVPERGINVYCSSKAAGERAALSADGLRRRGRPGEGDAPRLRTVVIRPCCIWGEGDPYHAASLVEMGRRGPVIRVGDGSARCQHSYVGNVAHGHALAGKALLEGREEGVAGEVFFITDFPAQNFFDYMEPIVVGAGYKLLPWSLSLPRWPLYQLGTALEALSRLVRPFYRYAPTVSRFSVDFVCQDFTVRGDKARERLGYQPIYSEEEAFERTIAYFRERPGA